MDVVGRQAHGVLPGHDRDRPLRASPTTARAGSATGTPSTAASSSPSRRRGTGRGSWRSASQADSAYKRLTRSIDVPAPGAQLSFWVNRNTEPDWDFFFVEAHTAGLDDWTTLAGPQRPHRDRTGAACPVGGSDLHPFLAHYQTARADGSCAASGSTGSWHAASG